MNGWGAQHHKTQTQHNAKQSKAKLLLLLLFKKKKKVVSRSRRVLYSESFISLSLPTVSPFNHIFDKRHLTHSVPFRSISFSLSLSTKFRTSLSSTTFMNIRDWYVKIEITALLSVITLSKVQLLLISFSYFFIFGSLLYI